MVPIKKMVIFMLHCTRFPSTFSLKPAKLQLMIWFNKSNQCHRMWEELSSLYAKLATTWDECPVQIYF